MTAGNPHPEGEAKPQGGAGHVHGPDCDHEHGKPSALSAGGTAGAMPMLGKLTPVAATGAPAAHDHSGHDHSGHDHAGHDHAGHAHDDGDDDGHGHGHHHHHHDGPPPKGWWLRLTVAGLLLIAVILVATLVSVRAGTAVVITRFGAPTRVQIEPGLAFKAPPPIEQTVEVDTRLHSTSSGYHTLTTKDSLSVEVQVFLFWRVAGNEKSVLQFVRALRNKPDDASDQLRTFLGSALQTVTGNYALSDLLNTDASKVRLGDFETALKDHMAQQLLDNYGIEVEQVGIERLMLPQTTVLATVKRMASERDTAAATEQAEGHRIAKQIESDALRDGRITIADANVKASETESAARKEAAEIYGRANSADPQLYVFLRSLDALDQAIGSNTRLILRTDAAPFRVLIDGPPGESATAAITDSATDDAVAPVPGNPEATSQPGSPPAPDAAPAPAPEHTFPVAPVQSFGR